MSQSTIEFVTRSVSVSVMNKCADFQKWAEEHNRGLCDRCNWNGAVMFGLCHKCDKAE